MQATIITDRIKTLRLSVLWRLMVRPCNSETRKQGLEMNFILQIMNPDRVVKAGGLYVGLGS